MPFLLLRRADLGRLWLGEVVSQAGDSVFQIALLWLALELTGSSAAAGLAAMAGTLPMLLVGLLAGALADRFDRRRLMLVADLGRTALVLALPLLHAAGQLNFTGLVAVTFAMAVFTAHFNPARDSLVPALVADSELRAANSWIQSGWQLALLLGPGLAGLLIPLTGEIQLFTVDGASFLVSFALIWAIRHRDGSAAGPVAPAGAAAAGDAPFDAPAAGARTGGAGAAGRPALVTQTPVDGRIASARVPLGATLRAALADVREGLAHAGSDRRLRVLLWMTAADNLFIMGPAIVGVPVYVRQTLGGTAEDYAFLLTAFALGTLAGTILLGWLGGRFRNSTLLLWGVVLDGLTFLPLAWTRTFAAAYLTLFVHSLVIPLIIVPRPTLVQTIVPPRLRGRVFSMISVAVVGLTAVSAGLTGLVAELVPMPAVYAAIAVLAAATGVAGWSVREFREGP